MAHFVTAMYLRLSKEDDGDRDESNSITSQRLLIQDYIHHRKDLSESQVVEYCDDGYSGTSMDRPDIQNLLEEVKKGKIQCIIVKDISRFSREYITTGDYLDQIFPFMGVRFISIGDRYDSLDNKGRTLEMDTAFKTMLYDFYAKDTAIKVKAAHRNRQENGIHMGQMPLGYARSGDGSGSIVIDPETAEVVRHIFDLAISGLSSVQIADALQDNKIPTPMELRGRKFPEGRRPVWNRNVVRNILNNRFYLGEMVYNKVRTVGIGKNKSHFVLPREEWKTIPAHHEPLVTEEEYQKVAKFGKSYPQKEESHPLTGRILCGGCGYHIYRKKSGNYGHFFWCPRKRITHNEDCSGSVAVTVIEELVLLELNNEIMLWGDAEKGLEDMKKHGKEQLSLIRRSIRENQDRKKAAENHLTGLYEQYSSGEITAAEYTERKAETEKQIAGWKEKESAKWEEYYAYQDEMNRLESDMKSIIRFSHIEKLTKEVVETFIDKVYLYKDKRIEIVWKFQSRGA